MARKRYTEEQIIGVLQQAGAGTKAAELCRKYGISEATYYNWKTKYAGMTVSELRRLKTLEAESRRLHAIAAVGIGRNNVRRYVAAESPPIYRQRDER